MRSKKVVKNAIAGLAYQILSVIYGLVVPILVIGVYGSKVNGLLQSITQFLSYISLMDAGVSAVIRSRLYKPLAEKNQPELQKLINSAKKFYRKVAVGFILYMFVIALVLPQIVGNEFDNLYSFSLIVIIGVSTFAEYFFGISYVVLLEADQRKYIVYIIQSVSLIINFAFSIILIKLGYSIHFVKICTSLIYVLRPIALSIICKKIFNIDKNDRSVIKIEHQWDGMGHHLAYFLHSHTDVIVLTIAKSTSIVSVYSVYNMITTGLLSLVIMATGGVEAAFGNMIAKKEKNALLSGLSIYEMCLFSIATIVFSTAAVMIIPFVSIYTKGVSDINYIQPIAAYLLIAAQTMYCIRQPYQSITMAAGKFRETMAGAFEEAILNIGLSFALVWKWGIAGVAFATLVAMIFRTIQYVFFLSKNVLERPIRVFVKKAVLYLGIGILLSTILIKLDFVCESYIQWSIQALVVMLIITMCVFALNVVFYRDEVNQLIIRIRSILPKKSI